jgi:pimeloyl-ACP methyl ester carboxylesterase
MQERGRNGAAPAQAEERYCVAADGTSIAYAVEGEGPTLVMCPAFWESFTDDPVLAEWEPVYRGRRIVRYDPRGVGRSGRNAPSLTHEAFVSDLEVVIEAVATEPIDLFAATFSVPWAIDYAERHPERVHRLILAHGYVRASDIASRENVDSFVAPIRSNWPMAAQLFSAQGFESDPGLGVQFGHVYTRNIAPDVAGQWFEALYESTDVQRLLGKISAPTFVRHRREDTVMPFAGAEEIAAGIPGARLVAQSGTGAISSGDDVEANLRLLVDFLDE